MGRAESTGLCDAGGGGDTAAKTVQLKEEHGGQGGGSHSKRPDIKTSD